MFIGDSLPESGTDLVTLVCCQHAIIEERTHLTYALTGLKVNLLHEICQSARECSIYQHQMRLKTRQK